MADIFPPASIFLPPSLCPLRYPLPYLTPTAYTQLASFRWPSSSHCHVHGLAATCSLSCGGRAHASTLYICTSHTSLYLVSLPPSDESVGQTKTGSGLISRPYPFQPIDSQYPFHTYFRSSFGLSSAVSGVCSFVVLCVSRAYFRSSLCSFSAICRHHLYGYRVSTIL